MYGLTDPQAKVLRIIASFDHRGAMCWQIRDRYFPADSPMRTKRTRGRNGRSGVVGGAGNLAIGRLCATLARKGLVMHSDSGARDFRYILTAKARKLLGLTDEGQLDLGGDDA